MTDYNVTVSYEVTLEAPDPRTAEQWAIEEVEHGHVAVCTAEALPAERTRREHA